MKTQPVISANDTMCPTCGLWFNARCWGDCPDCDGHNESATDDPVDETKEDREWVKSERRRVVGSFDNMEFDRNMSLVFTEVPDDDTDDESTEQDQDEAEAAYLAATDEAVQMVKEGVWR